MVAVRTSRRSICSTAIRPFGVENLWPVPPNFAKIAAKSVARLSKSEVRGMLSPNIILRERYRIIHELGHGGMGAVYQAMDENLSRVVAVKETFATTPEQRRAFKREAELLGNLSHPVLPTVSEHFEHGDGQFLVMQFVPGHDLAELLDLREQPFAETKVLAWADQILDALEDLHSCNPPIIHRDIKPSNLKVTPKGKIMLLDFGLAKGVAGQMSTVENDSQIKSIYGYTPSYAPLEQIRGGGTDARSDLYSLAATLWTLLTGIVPPDALTRVGEKEEGNPDPLLPAREINPKVSEGVSSVLAQTLSINRNQRPESAAQLRRALRHANDRKLDQPTLQKPPPLVQKSQTPISPPPLGSTVSSPEGEARQPISSDQHVPTMRVESPPQLPSLSRQSGSPTTTSSVPEKRRHPKRFRLPITVVGAIALAFLVLVAIVWRPWAGRQSANQPTSVPVATQPSSATENPRTPEGMVYVPGGEFMMGRDDGDEYERPVHKVGINPFFMDIDEVTFGSFREFIAANPYYRQTVPFDLFTNPKLTKQPVTGATWNDASVYCGWLKRRLPTEEEWEFAARGTDGRRYPWGNDWKRELANADTAKQAVVNVGSFKGSSPFGVFDMVGNAWEWTASPLTYYSGGSPSRLYGEMRVIRGGAYDSDRNTATTTFRRGYPTDGNYDYSKIGFRCAKDVY